MHRPFDDIPVNDHPSDAHLITAAWPVVIIMGPRHWDPAWIHAIDRRLTADVFGRKQPYALITDTRPIENVPGAKERKVLAEWLTRPDQLASTKRWNVGSSTIVKNAVMRGSLQALYWLWTPATPQHAARDLDEAWAWCIEALAARDVALGMPAADLKAIAETEVHRMK